MKQLYIFLFIILSGSISAQISQNMTLNSNWNDTSLPTSSGVRFNDIWGHVDCQGNEYAIVGSARYTHFFNVSNPNNISEVSRIEGTVNSIWRDFKTYKNYAYGVADQGNEGLSIFDMSNLPNSAFLVGRDDSDFTRAHNIFIDEENGRLYVAGSNGQNNGLIVYDLSENPASPQKIASVGLQGGGYVHDVYVRDNIAYCSHGWNGYYIWNMINPANPIALAATLTNGYNHSSWVTDDGNYAIVAEEVPAGLPLLVIDLTNLATGNIEIVKSFKEPLLAPGAVNNTPHNPFIRGKHLISSYYEDGVQVFDLSDPVNPDRIAYYDTAPQNTSYSGTNNNWGVYPYLPSGTIIATDTDNGFFVLTPDYDDVAPVGFNAEPNVEWVNSADINVCEGATVILETTGTAENYKWFKDGDLVEGEIGSSLTIQAGGIFSVEVDNVVCSKTLSSIDVNFQTLPSVAFTPTGISTIELCEGNSSTVSIPLGAQTYNWTKDGIFFSESNSIDINESGTYQVTASINGCPAVSEMINVNVTSFPDVGWSIPDSIAICSGDTTILEVQSGAELYEWYLFGVQLNGENNSSLKASATGDYYVEATNNGCTSTSDLIKVNVKPLPLAELNTNSPSVCEGETTTLFTNQGADSYTWTLNNVPFEEENFETTTNQAGTYQVTATQDACVNISNSIEIAVNTTPDVTLNSEDDVFICEGEQYSLVIPAGAENYQWFKDGIIIEDAVDPFYNISESGNYYIEASNGTCVNTSATVEITVRDFEAVEITSPTQNTIELCEGETVELMTTERDGIYQWFRNGIAIENTDENMITINENGTYQVMVDQNNCSGISNEIEVIVNALPIVDLNVDSTIGLCQGESFELNITEENGTYQWFRNGEAIENATNNSFNADESGNYYLQASNGDCSATSETIEITVTQTPIATIVEPQENTINLCEGTSIQFLAVPQNGTYQWLQNGNDITNTDNNSLMVTSEGTYQMMVTENGCSSLSEEIQVNTVLFPDVSLNVDTALAICVGESVMAEIPIGASSYEWFYNGAAIDNSDSNSFSLDAGGTYFVNASNNDCSVTSDVITLDINDLPNAEFTNINSNIIDICEGETSTLSVADGADLYFWTKDGEMLADLNTSTVEVSEAGTYQVTITQNNCTSTSSEVNLSVSPSPNVEFNTVNEINLCVNPTFNLSIAEGADMYQWFFNEMPINGATNSNLEVSEAGFYSVIAQTDACSATSSMIEAVAQATIDTTNTGTLVACGDETFSVTTTANLGDFEWIKDGEVVDTVSTIFTIEEPGDYQLVIYENDCPISVQMFSIDFVDPPSALAMVMGEPSICEGESVTLQASENDQGSTYTWFLDGATFGFGNSIEANTSGNYQMEVQAANGCISSSELIEITVNELPIAAIFTEDEQLTASIGEMFQWYLEGEIIAGATQQVYQVQETGNYSVEVIDENGCSAISDPIFIIIISTNEIESISSIEIFPNPASEIVTLQFESDVHKSYELTILNTIGQVIYSKQTKSFVGNQAETVTVENWESGVYFLQIRDQDQFLYKKIIVE